MSHRSKLILILCLPVLLVACDRDSSTESGHVMAPTAEFRDAKGAPTDTCQRMKQHHMSTTLDLGQTFIPFPAARQQTVSSTFGMAALDEAGTLAMFADGAFWVSVDDGCNWRRVRERPKPGADRVSTGPGDPIGGNFLMAGDGGVAYAWEINGRRLYRIQQDVGNARSWEVIPLRGAPESMNGFVVDPHDPLHVRTGGELGQLYESFSGGASWSWLGVPASQSFPQGLVVSFDPNDMDHVVYGRSIEGGYVSFDGGRSWTPSTGLAEAAGGRASLFSAVISPVDGNTVFAMGIDLDKFDARLPSLGKQIYASTDGGLTYEPVLENNEGGVFLTSGPVMMAWPTDADRLVFLSTSQPLFGGNFFYDFDLSDRTLNVIHNDRIPKIRALVPSSVTPGALHAAFDWI